MNRTTTAILLLAALLAGCADEGSDAREVLPLQSDGGGDADLAPDAFRVGRPPEDAGRRPDPPLPDPDAAWLDPDAAGLDPDAARPDADRRVPPADAGPEPDAARPPADAAVHQEPDPVPGFIGARCAADDDCLLPEAFCLREAEGYPGGSCSVDCDRFCPDQEGAPVTFCVDDVVAGGGACVSRCDYDHFHDGCRAGYRCRTLPRFGEPDVRRGVCVPGEPDGPRVGCLAELDARGMDYGLAEDPAAHPADRPDLTCHIVDALMLRSPVRGVRYRYVSQAEPRPMFMACELARAVDELSQLLRESDVLEVGHIGTYNCRLIAGTDSLSEHGLGLAIDLAWFRRSDGRVFSVEDHWEHDTDAPRTEEGRWLYELAHQMFERRLFNTVLTPNFNAAHDNHFHVDLAAGGRFLRSGDAAPRTLGPNPHGD